MEDVVLHTANINGDGLAHGDVPFGFHAGDADGSRVVNSPGKIFVLSNLGAVTRANYRGDSKADGSEQD